MEKTQNGSIQSTLSLLGVFPLISKLSTPKFKAYSSYKIILSVHIEQSE